MAVSGIPGALFGGSVRVLGYCPLARHSANSFSACNLGERFELVIKNDESHGALGALARLVCGKRTFEAYFISQE